MSAEDQEMLRRISLLAGQINRHKNQQAGLAHTPQSNYPYHGSNYRTLAEPYHARRSAIDGPEGTGYSSSWRRGGYPSRGHPRAHMSVHRHRSLVLNGASQQNRPADAESGANSDASTSSWVTKNDRHLQLINSSVYEKEVQARTRAIEQTRRQNRALRDQRERAKLMSHLQHVANGTGVGSTNSPATANNHEIVVQGIRFVVAKNGSKLIKVSDNLNSAKTTPKMAVVGGVRFYRTKNGNLYRHGVVHAQRHSGTVRKVDVPCQTFSMTGSCTKGPLCRFRHDPERVAACKDFLQQGECLSGPACDLSHDLGPERTPTCLHFLKDNCMKPDCKYAHVKVSPAAPVCRSFGKFGYCEKGASCPDRHAFECPDFSNNGVCKTKGCKLLHRERASVLRKVNAREMNGEDEEMADVSSDDETVDGDDVDSDEVDEFIGQDENSLDFAEQKDFIEL